MNRIRPQFISILLTTITIIVLLAGAPGFGISPALAFSTSFSNTIFGGIPDSSCITRTFVVTAPVGSLNFIISDVNIGVNVTHPRRSDISATLTSPTGTVVDLISGGGLGFPVIASPDNYENYDVLLDDSSINSLYDNDDDNTAAPLYDRNAKPFELLTAFKGEDAVGTWTLTVCDNRAGQTGSFNSAELTIFSADPTNVTGIVFTDYNDNGVRNQGDVAVPGVTVTAYDATGNQVAQTTTLADGSYTFSGIADGTQIRIEFSNIPSNLRPGAFGADSGTTVQFVTVPAAGVDLGLNKPDEYCNENPWIVSPCFINGNPLIPGGTAAGAKVLVSIPYNAYGRQDTNIENTLATGAQIGSTWGLAFQRSTGTVFAGALAKRHAGLGPLGPSGIYTVVMNPITGQVSSGPSNFIRLDTIIPSDFGDSILGNNTARGLPANSNMPNTDPTAWDAVGKTAIGDMDMGTDDDTLWLINLANQTLYSVYVGIPAQPPTAGDVTAYPIAPYVTGVTGCVTNDVRPWAVEIHEGTIYIGVVCSAESTQNVNNLHAYIISMDEDTPIGFSLVADIPLNYARGIVSDPDGGYPAAWRPWSTKMTSLCTAPCASEDDLAYEKQIIYPQPILSDIEFDTDGSIIVGLMDRLGHQTGNANYATSNAWDDDPGNPAIGVTLYNKDTYAQTNAIMSAGALYEGVSGGDTLRLCPGAGYVLEFNASCGGIATGGAGNLQGPGGGEYYWQDMYVDQFGPSTDPTAGIHNEITLGGLLLVPGTNEVAVSVFDPFSLRAGGVAWFNNLTGTRTRAYEVFGTDEGGGSSTFGKAAGLGDIEGFCFAAPIEIGNRVWVDADNDGIQDAGENPIQGVRVELYDQSGNFIGDVTTDSTGAYFFSSGPGTPSGNQLYLIDALNPNSQYEIRIPLGQPALAGLNLTVSNANGNTEDQRDSDGTEVGGNAVIPILTGSPGDNNHTYDFGFGGTYSLGNRVWFDTNNNALLDGGEFPIPTVLVELYRDDGATPGVWDVGDTLVTSDTTDAGGYYRFDNLTAGDYVVMIADDNFRNVGVTDTVPTDPLAGYWSSLTSIAANGAVADATANDPDTTLVDNDDNGQTTLLANTIDYVASAAVTLGPGSLEPTTDNDPVTNPELGEAANSRSDRTVDFGFYRLSLGDLVFEDVNNSGGFDAGDVPLQNVLVHLFAANGTTEIITGKDGIPGTADDAFGPDGIPGNGDDGQGGVLTDVNGNYLFNGLAQGSYVVKATAPNGYTSTRDDFDQNDNDSPVANTNNNDNGDGTGAGLTASAPIPLVPGGAGAQNQNVITQSAGTTHNPTMDFGFVQANNGILKTANPASLTIGELVTYQVVLTIPPSVAGTYDNAVVTDTMDRGLALFNCVSVTSSAAALTTSVAPGDFSTICANNVTTNDTGSGLPEDVDRQVVFSLGNIVNTGQTDATLTITYQAIVLDLPSNRGTLNNQTALNNTAVFTSSNGTLGPVSRQVTLVEPDLQIVKSSNTSFVAAGTPVDFTLTITHTANSLADAFDVLVTDPIPAELDYVPNSVDCDDGAQSAALVNCAYDAVTRTIIAEWSSFTRLPAGDQLLVRFSVTGNAALLPNQTVTNVGAVQWTSEIGDQSAADSFSNPPNSFATERFYDPLSPNPVNTIYGDNDALQLNPVAGGGGGGGRGTSPTSPTGTGFQILDTGFAPNIVTPLNVENKPSYAASGLVLDIPSIKVKSDVVGVQMKDGGWDLSWLQNQAGWLEGTAYPTWSGNSVISAHVVNADGKPGLFSRLKYVKTGDFIFVHNSGYVYTYKIVSNEYDSPDDISVLNHETKPVLTLVTCDSYDLNSKTYLRRVVVKAVLVSVSLER